MGIGSSKPRKHPKAFAAVVIDAIITERIGRRRCAEDVHQALKMKGIGVSLSSVKRTLDCCSLRKKRSPRKRPLDFIKRPDAAYCEALVEMDTIHISAPDGSRIYVYTLIDLFSQWAYAEITEKIGVEPSARFVRRAQKTAPFDLELVQTDHGSEFSTRFTHRLMVLGIRRRHSQVRQMDDQAHIERFNRTIQEECLDRTTHTATDFRKALKGYMPWYNGVRTHLSIDFKTPLEMIPFL